MTEEGESAGKPAGRRVRVDLGDPLHQKVDGAWGALMSANDEVEPRVLVRGNELVRMTERGELEPFIKDNLRDELSEVAQFERVVDGEPRAVDPPADIANVLLARDSARYEGAPRVDRVVDVPVLASDGSLITAPGCYPDARLYYRPSLDLGKTRPRPVKDTDDLDWALSFLLEELLGDFDFADVSSQAHALAMLLLPFVREYIKGSTPLHVVLAPDVGSGKTWLAQAALLPGCGVVPATPGTSNEEEWRKRITSSLLAGSGAVLLDNLSGTLDSGALASALTIDVWSDRVLGESREVRLPIRNVWVATGNNLGLAPEQVRRAVPIFLEPGEKKAADRDRKEFRHPDLLGWATEHRSELVSAALTLIQHWLDGPISIEGGYAITRTGEGPQQGGQTMGSYERWAAVMGGILESARVPGFLENRDRLKVEADPETKEAEEFLEGWFELGLDPLEMRELSSKCQFGMELHDHLPQDLVSVSSGARFGRALSVWLREHNRRWVGDFQLLASDGGRRRRWRVRSKRGAE